MSSLPPEPVAPYGGAYDCGVSVRRTLPSALQRACSSLKICTEGFTYLDVDTFYIPREIRTLISGPDRIWTPIHLKSGPDFPWNVSASKYGVKPSVHILREEHALCLSRGQRAAH